MNNKRMKRLLALLLVVIMSLPVGVYADFGPPGGGGGPPGGGGSPSDFGGGGGFPSDFPSGFPTDFSGYPSGFPGMPDGFSMPPGFVPPVMPGSTMPPSGTGWTTGEGGGFVPPDNFSPPDWWSAPEGWTFGDELPEGGAPWEQIGFGALELTSSQKELLNQAAQTGMMGFMPDFSELAKDFDFNSLPEGVIPAGMIPKGGFGIGEIPSGALPANFPLPEGMVLPPDIQVNIDLATGAFTKPDGSIVIIPEEYLPIIGANGATIEIPKLSDGRMLPLPPTALAAVSAGAGQEGAAAAVSGVSSEIKTELKSATGIDFENIENVSSAQFTSKFKSMDMDNLQDMGKDTLDALYNSMTADKLDITDPKVQERMDQVYTERNETLGIGDINTKVKELNNLAPEVFSLDRDSLDSMLSTLEANKKAGTGDLAKIEESIIKTKDAIASQQRLDTIRQQVAQLTEMQQRLEKRSEQILTEISVLGDMSFTPIEQQEIEEEIAASGDGSVVEQPAKIQELITKYEKLITPTSAPAKEALKLAALYEKTEDISKAHEVLASAMEENPNDNVIPIKMAQLYENSNELDKAAEVIQNSIRNNPLPQTQAVLADIQGKQGDYGAAADSIEAAIADSPGTEAYYEKANDLYQQDGDVKDYKVFVEGQKVAFDVPPKLENGRTLVPVRAITEAMGADVGYDDKTKKVTIVNGEDTIELVVGSKNALVNGKAVVMDVPARVVNGRTLLPLRFVSENTGNTVDYFGESNLISIK